MSADAAPVSRSQAKSVCNRLGKFEEAILDFDGIEWMGQGFAHQIFVVFQNAHPEISIVPLYIEKNGKLQMLSGYRDMTSLVICRNDQNGKAFDRKPLLEVSKALGHARTEVVSAHYLYN